MTGHDHRGSQGHDGGDHGGIRIVIRSTLRHCTDMSHRETYRLSLQLKVLDDWTDRDVTGRRDSRVRQSGGRFGGGQGDWA